MPVDTQNKRRSSAQLIVHMVMPVPSGTIGVGAREHATWLYSGIAPFTPLVSNVHLVSDLYWHVAPSE